MSKSKKRTNIVYSTNPDFNYDYDESDNIEETLAPPKQNLRIALDKKQRRGKVVTLVSGFVGLDSDLKELGKLLKSKCGVGGSIKDRNILIQGDFREKIMKILLDLDYKVKLI